MKGIVWHGPEQMSVEEVPEPAVEPGTVVVRPTAAGICGSEIEGYLGRMGNRTPPLVMGHEFAGTVTEVGEGADEDLLGRLVAVNPLSSDGTCRIPSDSSTPMNAAFPRREATSGCDRPPVSRASSIAYRNCSRMFVCS